MGFDPLVQFTDLTKVIVRRAHCLAALLPKNGQFLEVLLQEQPQPVAEPVRLDVVQGDAEIVVFEVEPRILVAAAVIVPKARLPTTRPTIRNASFTPSSA